MAEPGSTPRDGPSLVGIVIAAIAIVAAVVIGLIGYQRYSEWRGEKYVVTREDDGRAISRVVAAAFSTASALKVGGLSGTVQGVASDQRLFGLLQSDRIVKAPFTVDYFVDLSHLGRRDMAWDPRARALTVTVPDVTVGKPNVDEANATLVTTRGVFVTRGASEALQRAISVAATSTAAKAARQPERLDAARRSARSALQRLMEAPLDAAGYDDVSVRIRFPFDPAPADERWDVTKPIDRVLANAS